jgi:hypothetical protein
MLVATGTTDCCKRDPGLCSREAEWSYRCERESWGLLLESAAVLGVCDTEQCWRSGACGCVHFQWSYSRQYDWVDGCEYVALTLSLSITIVAFVAKQIVLPDTIAIAVWSRQSQLYHNDCCALATQSSLS